MCEGVQYVRIPGPLHTHGPDGIEIVASEFEEAYRQDKRDFEEWEATQHKKWKAEEKLKKETEDGGWHR